LRILFGFSLVTALLQIPMLGCCSVMGIAGVLLIVVCAALGAMAVTLGCWAATVAMGSMGVMVGRRAFSSVMVVMAARVLLGSITAGVAMVGRRGCCGVTAVVVAMGCLSLLSGPLRSRVGRRVARCSLRWSRDTTVVTVRMRESSVVMAGMAVTGPMVK